MKRAVVVAAIVVGPVASPAGAADDSLSSALHAGLLACDKWVLTPATWTDGADTFAGQIGLADRLDIVQKLPDGLVPQKLLGSASHFWRIGAGQGGVFVAASDREPICNVIGGGAADFQPATETILVEPAFAADWKRETSTHNGDMQTDSFASTQKPKATLTVSRADKPGSRTDRVQFLATLIYRLGKP